MTSSVGARGLCGPQARCNIVDHPRCPTHRSPYAPVRSTAAAAARHVRLQRSAADTSEQTQRANFAKLTLRLGSQIPDFHDVHTAQRRARHKTSV